MAYHSIFDLISAITEKTGISYVLIGGFAVNYYKISRQTADVDFLITVKGYKKILSLLEEAGFKQDYSQEVFARLSAKKTGLLDLDFMFIDEQTMGKILKDGKKISIAGKKFVVPSLEHLIALKLHAIKYNPKARELKDFLDIVDLIRVNHMNAKDNKFRTLCLKYGTIELYGKILAWIEQ